MNAPSDRSHGHGDLDADEAHGKPHLVDALDPRGWALSNNGALDERR